jgi:hypothetical protein
MKYLLLLLIFASCSKPKLECKSVTISVLNTRDQTVIYQMKDSTICGNHLLFLKKDGTKEPFIINDSTYYMITTVTIH